ncbi:hypothetical protein [Aeromonas veronii]|uniref:hypothetical protein n=1 Tax=Aeromonas veronii TaxID=654 RepID=UPI003B9FD1CC
MPTESFMSVRGCFENNSPNIHLEHMLIHIGCEGNMSDTMVTESEGSSVFSECLGIPKRISSARSTRYDVAESKTSRVMAVACALELIKTSVSSGALLEVQLEKLDQYANLIESALESE